MRTVTPLLTAVGALLMASCAAGNGSPRFSASHINLGLPTTPAPVPVILPPPCPPALKADILPPPPVPSDAGYPAAETQAASAAVEKYTEWLHDERSWGNAGWAYAAMAKAYCESAK